MKCHLFHFISLSYTFFLMPKLKLGKEMVKFLACFKLYAPKRFWRRVRPVRLVLPVRPVQPSQAQSNPVQPNPATPPPPGKEIGKETVNFLAFFDHQPIWPEMWSAVASEARHRFGIDGPSRTSQTAVAAAFCRRTP